MKRTKLISELLKEQKDANKNGQNFATKKTKTNIQNHHHQSSKTRNDQKSHDAIVACTNEQVGSTDDKEINVDRETSATFRDQRQVDERQSQISEIGQQIDQYYAKTTQLVEKTFENFLNYMNRVTSENISVSSGRKCIHRLSKRAFHLSKFTRYNRLLRLSN